MSKAKKTAAKAKTKTTSKAKSTPKATSAADAESAFRSFLGEAKALPKRDVIPFRADANLALHNVQIGAKAVLAERARLGKELPALDLSRIERLPALGLAVTFAAARVDPKARPVTQVRADLARAHEHRALMITAADSLVLAGLVPPREVAKIREGKGGLDAAQDCVDLAALFAKYPDAAKRTVVTSAQVKEAAALGSALLATMTPSSARTIGRRTAAERALADERNRMWTLLVSGHEELWRAGAWLFGRHAVDQRVPALQSRAVRPRRAPAKAAPTSVAAAE